MAETRPRIRRHGERPVSWSPFGELRREMDRLFEGYFPSLTETGGPGEMPWPSVDVHESDKAYTIEAELPGVAEDHVDVSISDGMLTIRGEKRSKSEEKDKQGRVIRSERSYGAFERSFPLPADADEDKISAESKAGVLTIRIPKTSQPKSGARKISVKSK